MAQPEVQSRDSQSIGVRLAAFLSDRREKIISGFLGDVQRDESVPTADELDRIQLRDDVPELLDALIQTLADSSKEGLKEDTAWTAAMHGIIRWREGYDITELLREFSHLRTRLIRCLVDFQETIDLTRASRLSVEISVHRFLDNAVRGSVDQYITMGDRSKR